MPALLGFIALLSLAMTACAEPTSPSHPELRAELLALYEEDQAARQALLDLIPGGAAGAQDFNIENPTLEHLQVILMVKAVDAKSLPFMRKVLDEHGFPSFAMVGEDGAEAAWILIQHADSDPAFQQRALAMMEPLVAAAQADASDYAHLTDRVLLAQGKPQRYATQFATDERGVLRPRATEDHATLAQRREAMGLLPMAQHVAALAEVLDKPTSAIPLETM
jgi:hypothetical protein